jgi:hypothetical protein
VSHGGYQLTPAELTTQVKALAALGDRADGLVRTAGELAQRLPKLGTAPPALHLAKQLRDAAGDTGLTGEVTAARAELARFHQDLAVIVADYVRQEHNVAGSLGAS